MSSTRYNIKYNREDIKNELTSFLKEGKRKGRVAMLRGDRGIGKTNLLKEVMAGRDDFIYVSLLEAASIDEIKNKITCRINSSYSKIINKLMGIKIFGFSLSSVTVLKSYIYENIIDKFLKNKVIIFDDIEISDPRVDIMSLSGLVNELKRKNKVILSPNEEELLQNEEKKEWVIFREKIIDVEYKLNISDEDMVNTERKMSNRDDIEERLKSFTNGYKEAYGVIALKGDWGIGKTHLLKKVMSQQELTKTNNFIYVSLFGITSINEIKDKIIFKIDNSDFKKIKKLMGRINIYGFPLATIYELFASISLKNKVIVFDDIERKSPKLDVISLLGFVNELKDKNKLIFILNEEKLLQNEQNREWVVFREKVIDIEYKLNISNEDMVNIVIETNEDWFDKLSNENKQNVKKALLSLNIKNIRMGNLILKRLLPILEKLDRMFSNEELKIFERTIKDTSFIFMLFFENHITNIIPNDMFELLKKYSRTQQRYEKWIGKEQMTYPKIEEFKELSSKLKESKIYLPNDLLEIILTNLEYGFIEDNSQLEKLLKRIKEKTEKRLNDDKLLRLVDEIRFNPNFNYLNITRNVEELVQLDYISNYHLAELYKILNIMNHKDKDKLMPKIISVLEGNPDAFDPTFKNSVQNLQLIVKNTGERNIEGLCHSLSSCIQNLNNLPARYERYANDYKENIRHHINSYSIDELKKELLSYENLKEFIEFTKSEAQKPKFEKEYYKFNINNQSYEKFISTFESLYNKVINSSLPEDAGLKVVFQLMYEDF